MRILVSGASVAGPVLAYWLTRHGFAVTLVERAPTLRKTGNNTPTDTSGTDTMSGHVGTDTINVQDGVGGDTANGRLGNDTCTTDPGDTATSC
ncbi:hypothetical protein AB0E78_23850 [Streptomyces sp. NPDC032198]|uniref:hypothetical protein n=1 Tax=Streptomyces sp. NPDC032198 TaxID=3155127 RepID=UPI0034008B3F